jgi:hypothetical protein
MDPMMKIPKDRKPLKVGRTCLLIGMTVLLYLTLAGRFGFAAEIFAAVAR